MAKGWFRRKKGKLVYTCNNACGKERSKVVGLATLTNDEGWLEVGRLGLNKLVSEFDQAKPTLSQVAAYYFANKEFKKPSTKSLHEQIVNGLLVPEFGDKVAVDIKPKSIKAWLKSLELEDSTRAKYRSVMSAVYRFAISEEVLPEFIALEDGNLRSANPCSRVKGFSSVSGYEAMTLEPEQTYRVLEFLKQPVYTLLLLIAVTGLRMSEALGLRWMDVLFDRGLIKIRQTYVHNVMQDGAKTRASTTSVEMHALLAAVVKTWKEHTLYSKPEDYVFASYKLDGKKPRVGSMVVEDYLRPAAIKAGVIKVDEHGRTFDMDGNQIKRFGFHTFRHSLASFLMAEGENPAVVQATLRHTRLDMTMYYAHARKQQKRDAQGRMLEAVLGGERVLQREREQIQ
jgi:integrase